MSFLAARMEHIVQKTVSSSFLSGSSPNTNERTIWMVKFLFYHLNIVMVGKDIAEEEMSSRTLGISRPDDGNLFSC